MAGIYIHIPFCRRACTYCNFHFSTALKGKDDMVLAIIRETGLRRDFLQGQPVKTVYLGGGTPSLLTADELNRIFDSITATFGLNDVTEITIEANPDDVTHQYLKALRSTPVNRFSMGLQSFREEDLQYMNRIHTAQQSEYAIKAAQDAGYSNISIDLIYGTPGLTDKAWKANLRKTFELDVPHFSAYALTVEEGTALHHQIAKKKAAPVDATQAATQFRILMDEAADNGYEHYEISNFAKPGMYAVHNTSYWQGVPYVGIGPSAHSFRMGERSWNVANNTLYVQSILGLHSLPSESETLSSTQQLNEYIMTSLRTMWGTDLLKVAMEWGNEALDNLRAESARYIADGRAAIRDEKLLLTNEGKLFADAIAGDLFQ